MKIKTVLKSLANRRLRLGLIVVGALLLVLPPAAHLAASPIRFHQFEVAKLETRHLDITAGSIAQTLRSVYGSGWSVLRGQPRGTAPRFEESRAMLDYVFSWIPSYAVVYPTERFYYFQTKVEGKEVWGNFRVADLAKGKLMFSYFLTPIAQGSIRTLELSAQDGLAVAKRSDDAFDVTWQGRTVRFVIEDLGTTQPRKLKLLPEEECAGHVHDDSGMKFFLLYNRETRAFYYVLDDENGLPETFQDLEGGLVFGRRTEFVFYRDADYGRRILVGVSFKNIEANNYFDGPGDQVPIGLDLREKMYAAYPSARFGAGLDEHGVLLGQDQWCRYVIAPYLPYSKVGDVAARVKRADPLLPKGTFWTAITKEWWWTAAFVESTRERLRSEGKPTEMPPIEFHRGAP